MERYIDRINSLIEKINPKLLDLEKKRKHGKPPSQVSSFFLVNKERGDWAEKTLLYAINSNSSEYIAIQYGKSDDIMAGENGFKEFYEKYQQELDEIGKRPDILIFDKKDLVGIDISSLTDEVVSKAKCGIEVRSSSFISQDYESFQKKKNVSAKKGKSCKELNFTPKVEDLKVVYKWVKKFEVPHYYVQFFWDKVYGISFEKILELLNEGKYCIKGYAKNQEKKIVNIPLSSGFLLSSEVSEVDPENLKVGKKNLENGNLLFYVKFDRSEAVLKKDSFNNLFGIEL